MRCGRQAKIALKAKSEDQLLELEAVAKSLNLCARAVQDSYVLRPFFDHSVCVDMVSF